ncbi:MAG: Ig-like domain-containing protein [Gemmatimonadaceae bacterium]
MKRTASVLRGACAALVILTPAAAVAQGSGLTLKVTPAVQRMVARDTLRLTAQLLDGNGAVVPNASIRYFAGGGSFEAHVDSTGLIHSGAVGRLPVVISALVPGSRPIVKRVEVDMVPGAAASVVVSPKPARLLVGQRLPLQALARSADGDSATEVVRWSSSAPSVVRVSDEGVAVAVGVGKARITAVAGAANGTVDVNVISLNGGTISVTPATTRARQGDVVRFTATIKDAAGKAVEGVTPAWSMSPGRGEIGADGSFVGYEPGTYAVTANAGRLSTTVSVTLAERNVRKKPTVVISVLRTAFVTSEVWVHPNGKVAYLGTHAGGDRFYVIDISDVAKPVVVDSVVDNFRIVNDIMTDEKGEVLIFTREGADNRRNGVVLCTLQDPLHPKKVADFTTDLTSGVHSSFIHTDRSTAGTRT